MPNAHIWLLQRLAIDQGMPSPWLRRYSSRKAVWRETVSTYYNIGLDRAKKLLLSAANGHLYSPSADLGPLPFIDMLAQACAALRSKVCELYPGDVEFFRSQGRPRPDRTTFAYYLHEQEDHVLADIKEGAQALGYAVLCLPSKQAPPARSFWR